MRGRSTLLAALAMAAAHVEWTDPQWPAPAPSGPSYPVSRTGGGHAKARREAAKARRRRAAKR